LALQGACEVLCSTYREFLSTMASKTPASIGAAVSWFIAFLWFVAICTPMNWLWCENLIVRVRLTLWTLKLQKGIVAWGAKLLMDLTYQNQLTSLIMDLFEQDLWLEDGSTRLCNPAIHAIWQWCDEVMMLKYASFAMLFFGFVACGLTCAGGVFMYYYAHEHATRTGRLWAQGCIIGAPVSGFIGVLQYLLLTIPFNEAMNKHGLNSTSMYGPGLIICCMLTLASCVPIYIYFVFGKRNLYEKNDATYGEDPSVNFGGYGAVGGSGGYAGNAWGNQGPAPPPAGPVMYGAPPSAGPAMYGAPAANVYVTQVEVPLAPHTQHYQGPGAGQAAW